jgi:UDP-2,3-diacylglucosamine pyrophosphatase LpxH
VPSAQNQLISVHDRLIKALHGVADVSVISRVCDSRIGFPDEKDLRIFIPDLHLISSARLKAGHYKFATNNEGFLVRVLAAIKKLKSDVADDEQVNVTQLGDILDLWREVPHIRPTKDTPAQIANDHIPLINALRDPELDVTIFFGNHDFELYQWASYDRLVRKVFIPEENPHVLIVHGDAFDWLERLPDLVQEIFVYLFAPGVEPGTIQLGKMREATQKTTPDPSQTAFIKCASPAVVGQLRAASSPLPDYYNVQRPENAGAQVVLFDKAVETIKKLKKEHTIDISMVIIGHTHHARIVVQEKDGKPYMLMDCGAWIENCVGAGGKAEPNAQIGVLCGNDARVYQLRPRQT